jgi:hypothetical protein
MVIDIHYSLDDRRELRVVELRFRQYRKGDWFLGVKSKPKAL